MIIIWQSLPFIGNWAQDDTKYLELTLTTIT